METENEVKTDPEPQQENGAEKMEASNGNGNAENGDAPSQELKPGTHPSFYIKVLNLYAFVINYFL